MAGDDWLDLYMHYARHQVSPEIYHRWCGLTVLSAALERRVWLTRGYETLRIYPGQIMTVLVGKSALDKKTTAINMAADLLRCLEPWQFCRLPKKTSPQELLATLRKLDEDSVPMKIPVGPRAGRRVNSSGFVVAGELAVFFSTDNFNEMMAATINDLNDAPAGKHYVRFRSWQAELWNPIVGMLGGITPKGIAQELPKAARSAGFFGRVLWVHSGAPPRGNPLTEKIVEEVGLKKRLQDGIRAAAMCYGPYGFTVQGKKWFEDWYNGDYFPRLTRMEMRGVMDASGYWGRKDGHLLRVAMTCAAARSWATDRWLRRVDLERAHKLLAELERGFEAAMSEIGVGIYAEENARLLAFIESRQSRANSNGWVQRREVQKYANDRLGMRWAQLDDGLTRLLESGDLRKRQVSRRAGEWEYQRVFQRGELIRRAQEERPDVGADADVRA